MYLAFINNRVTFVIFLPIHIAICEKSSNLMIHTMIFVKVQIQVYITVSTVELWQFIGQLMWYFTSQYIYDSLNFDSSYTFLLTKSDHKFLSDILSQTNRVTTRWFDGLIYFFLFSSFSVLKTFVKLENNKHSFLPYISMKIKMISVIFHP